MNTSVKSTRKAFGVAVATIMSSPIISNANINYNVFNSSYNCTGNYVTQKQTTVDSSRIQNDVDMSKKMEIASFNEIIQDTFNTKIIQTWIPADNILEKSCLFIEVKNQEILMKEHEDFELKLYLILKTKINKSNFFNMIALM
jgi:hypothetical protein